MFRLFFSANNTLVDLCYTSAIHFSPTFPIQNTHRPKLLDYTTCSAVHQTVIISNMLPLCINSCTYAYLRRGKRAETHQLLHGGREILSCMLWMTWIETFFELVIIWGTCSQFCRSDYLRRLLFYVVYLDLNVE